MGSLRALRAGTRLARYAVGLLGVALLLSFALADSGAAAAGLAFPAPAGTQWSVVAGYNTATHIGTDPYAIDVVRDDGETSGTPVLAPADGTLSISANCLTVRDASRVAILLCHVLPSAGVRAGQRVVQGQAIGSVAPPGQAGNNGLAHIHIAVHVADGGRGFGNTIPLAGAYALEGVQFLATTATNGYAGVTLRSTNVQSAAPATTAPVAIANTPSSGGPAAGAASGRLAGYTPGGRSLAVVVDASTTDELVASARAAVGASSARPCTLSSLVGGAWVTYVEGAPAAVNARWRTVYTSSVPAMTPLFAACG